MKKIAERITRRKFVEGAVLTAVGAPMIVPRSIFGAESVAAPSERITVGFIG